MTEPLFFVSPAEMRRWLEKNHATATELIAGFHKKSTGRPTLTWSDAVDRALCFGWVDSIRRSIDAGSYTNRFTPRKPRSNWSAVNIAKVGALSKAGLMRPAGLAAFARREGVAGYSYEQPAVPRLEAAAETRFRAQKRAWAAFARMAPSYRKAAVWWVASAKRPETRMRRLQLIDASKAEIKVGALTRPAERDRATGRSLAARSPSPRARPRR